MGRACACCVAATGSPASASGWWRSRCSWRSTIGFLFLVATAHDGVDLQGRPIGTDFSNVYAAGSYVLEGQPEAPFDPPHQYAREQAIFGTATPFYGWHYPPYFLFIAGALAKMPYGLALAVWQASDTCALSAGDLRDRRSSSRGLPSARQSRCRLAPTSLGCLPHSAPGKARGCSSPSPSRPCSINIGHGHNGFLTAALLGGALVVLDRRPVLAGILFGLLVYKPQFGLMIPIVLAASGSGAALRPRPPRSRC